MFRSLIVVLIVSVIEILCNSPVAGYKWVHAKQGSRLPSNAKVLSLDLKTYIGRARHYDEILPAEVHNSSCAFVKSCSQIIMKREFEVLVDAEDCEETVKLTSPISNVPHNILRVGNRRTGEPIYLAIARDIQYNRIAKVFLTSGEIAKWDSGYTKPLIITRQLYNYNYGEAINDSHDSKNYALFTYICKSANEWVDTSAKKLPKDTVSGGNSSDGNDIYVARLKRDCDIIPGQVIPDLGIATAIYKGEVIDSPYCEVLVGDSDRFVWVSAQKGEIPDYAVVAAKLGNELMYVARKNLTVGYVVHSTAVNELMTYEILVNNEQ